MEQGDSWMALISCLVRRQWMDPFLAQRYLALLEKLLLICVMEIDFTGNPGVFTNQQRNSLGYISLTKVRKR